MNIARQNSDDLLRLLAAEESYKARARAIQALRLTVSIGAACCSLVVAFIPEFQTTAVIVGVLAAVTVLVAGYSESKQVIVAACIKDAFDASLFGIPRSKLNTSYPTDEEVVHRARSVRGGAKRFRDWYPDPSGLPDGYARLLCQRASVVWDLRLRKRVGWIAITIAFLISASLLIVALIFDLTLRSFLASWVAPLTALLLFLVQMGSRHLSVAQERAKILDVIEQAWKEGVGGSADVATATTISIQEAIFRARTEGPVVPRVMQRLHDPAFVHEMRRVSDQLREELVESRQSL